jgi:small redox-active disulfide protein 2
MSSDEITRIKVGRDRIGIVGLKSIISEVAEASATKTDEETRTELLKRLHRRNYIPESSREEYGNAFLREFNKFIGCPTESSSLDGLEIKVLGPGCTRCNQLEQDLMTVMAEMNLPADIEHVTDTVEISNYGVMGTPALIVNGEVKAVGSVPPKIKLKKWLQEAAAKVPNK